jgi:hypothetical protein
MKKRQQNLEANDLDRRWPRTMFNVCHLLDPAPHFSLLLHYIPLLDIFSEADQHEKSARDGQDGQGIEDQQ